LRIPADGGTKILNIATGMPAVFVLPQAGLQQDLGTSLSQKSLNLRASFIAQFTLFV
jgi:hypothetical protein